MRDAARTLALPFDDGELSLPDAGRRWLFVNADPVAGWEDRVLAVQDHRGQFLVLRRAGFAVEPEIPDAAFAGALILVSRSRRQTEGWIASAASRVAPGGTIVVAGEKNLGIASLRKRIGETVPIVGSFAKHHATVFWFTVPDIGGAFAALAASEAEMSAGEYETADGVFSQGHVDEGSRMLAQLAPGNLAGDVADFGAGWGYLSIEAGRKCPAIGHVDLYDASHAALELARRNMARLAPQCRAAFHWHDLTMEPVERRYDAILMNPPFHSGRAAEPALGQAFIAAASRALKPGGRLYMVANRQLPYEAALASGFRKFTTLAEAGRYKAVEAVR